MSNSIPVNVEEALRDAGFAVCLPCFIALCKQFSICRYEKSQVAQLSVNRAAEMKKAAQ